MSAGSYRRAVAGLQSRVTSRAVSVDERDRLRVARVLLVQRLAEGGCGACAGFAGKPVGSVTIAHLLRFHRVEYDAL